MSVIGSIVAWLVNSVLFASSFIWLLIPYNAKSQWLKWPLFVAHWLLMEQVQLNAGFGYPFFILGSVLGEVPSLIKWYSITGVAGGTLLILIVNITIYYLLQDLRSIRLWVILMSVLLLPILVNQVTKVRRPYEHLETVMLHPDVNCYNEKFEKSSDELVEDYINLSNTAVNLNTELLVWPETAITDLGWRSSISNHHTIHRIAGEYNSMNLSVISGAILYDQSNESDVRASYSSDLDTYYKSFNAAFALTNTNELGLTVKEKLVPFEEYILYPQLNKLISLFLDSVTGKKFSKTGQSRNVFPTDKGNIGSLICYEVIFGEFVSDVGQRSNGLVLLMNEGWYDNLWASEQFWAMARIRAIENQRAIAISSNRGKSGMFDYRGNEVYFAQKEPIALTVELPLVKGSTFYSRYNNLLGKIIRYTYFVFMLLLVAMKMREKLNVTTKLSGII